MRTEQGWLAEGIVSNVFFAAGGVIYTPSLDTGILPGITRARVMELAQGAGFRVVEGLYRWEDLLRADEVWTTGSVQELVPVSVLTGGGGQPHVPGAGVIGPISRQLLELYRADCKSGGGDSIF